MENFDVLGRPNGVRRRLNIEEVIRATTLLQEGRSQRYVVQLFHVTQSVISRLWNRHREYGFVVRRPYPQRVRRTTRRQDRYLVQAALRERTLTARNLQNLLIIATGTRISTQTVRNRLHEVNIRSRRAAVMSHLTANHRRSRRIFAPEHLLSGAWISGGYALFTDESRFRLSHNDARRRVYRRPNERYLDATVRETIHFGGGSVMVWGGITLNGRTALHVFLDGTVNAWTICYSICSSAWSRIHLITG